MEFTSPNVIYSDWKDVVCNECWVLCHATMWRKLSLMSCYNVAHYKYIKCFKIIHYMWKSIIKVPRNLIHCSNYISLIKSFKTLKKFIIFNIVLIYHKFLFWWKFSVTWYASYHINLILLFHYLFIVQFQWC